MTDAQIPAPDDDVFGLSPDESVPTLILSSQQSPSAESQEWPCLGDSRYKLRELLGQGGMSTIYVARDLKLARDVAVKVLRSLPADLAAEQIAYANEARILSYLSHPGVAAVYDCGMAEDGRPYHVMKLVEGNTLEQLLKDDRPQAARLLTIFVDVCQTVAYAHSRGILHLDLKPANIMVGAYGEVYVMDWGLARFEASSSAYAANTEIAQDASAKVFAIAGTPQYMSPEQARGEALNAQADVFALGALLCEILIGQAPYSGETVRQIHKMALRAAMGEAISELEGCETDRTLIALTRKCLSPNPRDRPRDADAVVQALAAYQETALQRAEADLARFFELSLDLFCIADFEGYFQRINNNFMKLLGYSESELLARPFMDFVHADDVAETISCMSTLEHGHPVVRFSNRYRTAHGHFVVLEWTAKAVADEGMIFAVARDISTPGHERPPV